MLLQCSLRYGLKQIETDGVIQTWWRKSPDFPTRQFAGEGLVHFVYERACGERIFSPRYLTRGAERKWKREKSRHKTLNLQGVQGFYKV